MKDLHTHALPFIDDGANSFEMSIQMLEESFGQGVILCALTPHCVIHSEEDISKFLDKAQDCYEELKKHTEKKQIPKLVLGAEVYADHDISQHKDISGLCIGKSQYILLELPFMKKYGWFAECVYSLNLMGLKVIVAHIDRYPNWEEIVDDLRGLKVVYEISASAFLCFSGRRMVKKLIKKGGKFIISSDMHNITTRKCLIKKAFEKAKKLDADFAEDCLKSIDIN